VPFVWVGVTPLNVICTLGIFPLFSSLLRSEHPLLCGSVPPLIVHRGFCGGQMSSTLTSETCNLSLFCVVFLSLVSMFLISPAACCPFSAYVDSPPPPPPNLSAWSYLFFPHNPNTLSSSAPKIISFPSHLPSPSTLYFFPPSPTLTGRPSYRDDDFFGSSFGGLGDFESNPPPPPPPNFLLGRLKPLFLCSYEIMVMITIFPDIFFLAFFFYLFLQPLETNLFFLFQVISQNAHHFS